MALRALLCIIKARYIKLQLSEQKLIENSMGTAWMGAIATTFSTIKLNLHFGKSHEQDDRPGLL